MLQLPDSGFVFLRRITMEFLAFIGLCTITVLALIGLVCIVFTILDN